MPTQRTEPVPEIAAGIRRQIRAADSSTVPVLRQLRREFTRRLKPLDASEVFDVAFDLLDSGDVPRWFVYELIHYHADAMGRLNVRMLERLGDGLSAWHDVDPFAYYLTGPAWREGQIAGTAVHRWVKSRDRWWRRVAVVSTVALNNKTRGGSGDTARTLGVCEIVKSDRDDMIEKAVSWSLRELAKRDAAAVSQFLASNENVLAPRVLREVRNKLSTGLKNPRPSKSRLNFDEF